MIFSYLKLPSNRSDQDQGENYPERVEAKRVNMVSSLSPTVDIDGADNTGSKNSRGLSGFQKLQGLHIGDKGSRKFI